MADTEKVTINMNVVDLGKIDLLVDEGFYTNRTDFIRSAIRYQLNRHDDSVKSSIVRRSMVLGTLNLTAAGLEKRRVRSEKLSILVVGVVTIADDVDPQLAADVIESIKVYGSLRANKAVQQALADRMQ
ncbi:MAG: hypothetical protein KC425_24315 [Anaerolineales bacterium]|nr:hypothetical protein [Anaerolineales bacterium]